MSSNNFIKDLFLFLKGDIFRTVISYTLKQTPNGEIKTWTTILYFKAVYVSPGCTLQQFFDAYIDGVINRLRLIQGSSVRWNFIKLEPLDKNIAGAPSVTVYRLTGVYGKMNLPCNPNNGFQFELVPQKDPLVRRLHIWGIPDILNFFDHPDNPGIKADVENAAYAFYEPIGSKFFKKDPKTELVSEKNVFSFFGKK